QAEDGIRDRTVTGVQTCALPIFRREQPAPLPATGTMRIHLEVGPLENPGHHHRPFCLNGSLFPGVQPFHERVREITLDRLLLLRSEERRVGKEVTVRGGVGAGWW